MAPIISRLSSLGGGGTGGFSFGKRKAPTSVSGLDGSTEALAAPNAASILAINPSAPDGLYWIKPPGGTGTAFRTYCIMQRYGGGWMKAIQYHGGTNVSGTAAINSGGTWINSEINANQAGKIHTTDFSALKGTSFLFRVANGGDNLFNNGAGTARLSYSTTLTDWGTDLDPTGTYTLSLDNTSDGTFDYAVQYTNDPQGRCNHATNIWISDHNYNGTAISTPPYVSSGFAICWTFGPTALYTNLHWMSGLSSQSGGSISWGAVGSTAAVVFIKP
jgi:hypothetical protein